MFVIPGNGIDRNMLKQGLSWIKKSVFPRRVVTSSRYQVSRYEGIGNVRGESVAKLFIDKRDKLIVYDITEYFGVASVLLHVAHRDDIEVFFAIWKRRSNKVKNITLNIICFYAIIISSIRTEPIYNNSMYSGKTAARHKSS